MCAPVLIFGQKQNCHSTESISGTFMWRLLPRGEWRRAFVEFRTVETAQKRGRVKAVQVSGLLLSKQISWKK
jgi:hypothetical protein